MSTEYYTLEKAAEVLALPTAEINRLRERNELRAFRDGSSWKFRKVDVDNYLAEMIKNRGKQKASESDFDLLGSDDEEETPTLLADSVSFDALMEDGLTLDDEMVDAKTPPPKATDDLVLADGQGAEVDLSLGDDEVVLDGTGSSPKLNLAQDSGLSLLDADVELEAVERSGSDANLEIDDDDLLSLVEAETAEQTSTIAIPIIEEEFQLMPSADIHTDDSESSSQVIALEEDNMFGAPIGATTGPSFGTPSFGEPAPLDAATAGPFGGGPGEFVASTMPTYAGPAFTEPEYKPWIVGFLVVNVFLLAVCGWFGLDLLINIWSWKEPFVINSTPLDVVAKLFGLI